MNEIRHMLYIFPIAVTLHNIEEALWLPEWSQSAGKFHQSVKRNEFYFAVLGVTISAYMVTFMYLLYPQLNIAKYLLHGFMGTMILNGIFPHIISNLVLRKYAPGVLTGAFINVPFFSIIIHRAIKYEIITLKEFGISTIVVSIMLLSVLPLLFRIGRKILEP